MSCPRCPSTPSTRPNSLPAWRIRPSRRPLRTAGAGQGPVPEHGGLLLQFRSVADGSLRYTGVPRGGRTGAGDLHGGVLAGAAAAAPPPGGAAADGTGTGG